MNKKPNKVIQAQYTTSELTIYQGNPLIEALPDYIRYASEEIADALRGQAPQRPSPLASRRQRAHWLASLGSDFFIPQARHIKLHDLIDIMIRHGYLHRNPTGSEAATFLQREAQTQKNRLDRISKTTRSHSEPVSASVIGSSGTGKTRSVDQILSLYPQLIHHNLARDGWVFDQIVYLKVECPHDGSIKSLCISIISAIDELTKEDFLGLYVKKGRVTTALLEERLAHLMSLYHVGLLVIDEIQNLVAKRHNKQELFNFIVSIGNRLGVPILYVGTPEVGEFMSEKLRVGRRFGSLGTVNWSRLEKGKRSREWENFLAALWRFNVLPEKTEQIAPKLDQALYECSQGVPAILIRLFNASQMAAMVLGESSLTESLVKNTFKEEFSSVKPFIEALKSGDALAISQCSDLSLPQDLYDRQMDLLNKNIDEQGCESEEKTEEQLRDRLRRDLSELGPMTPKVKEVLLAIASSGMTEDEFKSLLEAEDESATADPV